MLRTVEHINAAKKPPVLLLCSVLQTRALIIKYPSVLLGSSNYVKGCVDRFRQLCYTREEWARDFDTISPSLLAYFLRDAGDQLMRLEYLASTGVRFIVKFTGSTMRPLQYVVACSRAPSTCCWVSCTAFAACHAHIARSALLHHKLQAVFDPPMSCARVVTFANPLSFFRS